MNDTLILFKAFQANIHPLFFDKPNENMDNANKYKENNDYKGLAKFFDYEFLDLVIIALIKGYTLSQICDSAHQALFVAFIKELEREGAFNHDDEDEK